MGSTTYEEPNKKASEIGSKAYIYHHFYKLSALLQVLLGNR
jgi:hypothetical protein